VRFSRLHIPETLITTPIIAFVAGYSAILLATWIRDTYDARYAPKGPSEAEIAAEVQLLLANARASIDREASR
jgi:hypothetical protein